MKITRKEFFVKTGQGVAIIAIPAIFSSFLESCSPPNSPTNNTAALPAVSGTLSNGIVTVVIDSSSVLAKTGSTAIVNFASGSVLVDRPTAASFVAMTAVCTHQGCTINSFDSSNNQFVCPCHGSRFDENGKVIQGPASTNLQIYQTQFANNTLTITL
jgi:cytochrome b6-f complex iron-sulfur subunit